MIQIDSPRILQSSDLRYNLHKLLKYIYNTKMELHL